jgi:integrase
MMPHREETEMRPWIEPYATKSGERFRVGWRDEDGKRQSKSFATRAEANAFAESISDPGEFRARRALANLVGKRIDGAIKEARGPSLVEYLRSLIKADSELRIGTREGYESVIRTHLDGTSLGERPIAQIEARHVREYFAERSSIGPGARRNVHQIMVKAFTQAQREGLINVSPLYAGGIKRPSKERQKELVPLTVREIVSLQEAAPDPMLGLTIKVAGFSGLRAGEIGGLRVEDIDFKKCRISVRQATHRSHKTRGVGPLKTRAARRTVTVACSVVKEIAEFLKDHPAASDGRIFTTKVGRGYLTDVRLNEAIHEAAEKAGIREGDVHFHETRHAFASLWHDAGGSLKGLQVAMGHSDIRTTLGLYAHLYDEHDQVVADALEARLEAHRSGKG